MTVEERSGSCPICWARDGQDGELVCRPCQSRVRNQLDEIPLLCALLRAGARPQVTAGDLTEVRELARALAADELLAELEDAPEGWFTAEVRTRRALHIDAAPIPGASSAPRVGGSRERPMPIRADAADLLDIADERMVGDYHQVPMVRYTDEKTWQTTWFDGKPVRQEVRVREVVSVERKSVCRCGHPELHQRGRPVMVPAADQIGKVSVASVLNGWVRDFAETRREHGPEPLVPLLCRYLTDRLDWAFTKHRAVDEFAGEVDDVWHALLAAAGLPRPRPELCQGIPCKTDSCDLRTLYRMPVSYFKAPEFVECWSCHRLYSLEEFEDWAKLNHAAVCGKRHGDWWCALVKKHDGECEPFSGEEEAG